MSKTLQTISPIDGAVYVERPYSTDADINNALALSVIAQAEWKKTDLNIRKAICQKAVKSIMDNQTIISEEISRQMGRPIQYTPGEVRGFVERARYMIDIAGSKLENIKVGELQGFTRYIQREPVGVVFTIVPWNFPYLTAVNSIIPAIMAGNAVIMKPSSQTPLTGERLVEAFASAGLPKGLFHSLLLTHDATKKIIQADQVNYVSFTGSVAGGQFVEQAAAGRFIDVGLELGGKDPAYVRADVNIDHAVENLVDGVYFNSGQSCCGIERIYVHQDVYDNFVDGFVSQVKKYKLGNPLDLNTTLGPMVRTELAEKVRNQIQEAVKKGAKTCIDKNQFKEDKPFSPYLSPQVVLEVDHSMKLMTEENFGPVVGIMKVFSDDEAIRFMNDSQYGLTASVWTQDEQAAIEIGNKIQTGTWFMNRCDYLDPAMAWSGVKHSGKGCSLSELGYEKLTRPKSFHLRTKL